MQRRYPQVPNLVTRPSPLRLGINASPEPFSNILASLVEDGLVTGVMLLAIDQPVPAAAIALVLLVTGLVFVVLLMRRIRRALGVLQTRFRPGCFTGLRVAADSNCVTVTTDKLPKRGSESSSDDVVTRVERVAVLLDLAILDTPPQPAYDDVASLAAAACRSDVGAVNFVDHDRHWTMAIVGVEEGQGVSVPAELSLCAATIRTDNGVLTIGDTLADDRWREHPFVTGEPRLRSYAGASIVVSGQPIGVVCVFGGEPREFTDAEERALGALARQASAHLELRQRNSELRELAITDPLTGLANRTLLFDRLNLALAQRKRSGQEVGVLFCDVDGFKSVNDRFGHGAGDRLLRDIADQLRSAVRDVDTVARIAGDEFVVICPGIGGRAELDIVAGTMMDDVERIDPMPDGTAPPSLSVGAFLVEDAELAAEALGRADAAMYIVKAAD